MVGAASKSEVMGPPAPVEFTEPNDTNVVPFYFVVLALGLGLCGLVTFLPLERGRPPQLAGLLLLLPVAWFAHRVIGFLRERRAFSFGVDALEVPRLSPFGSPRRIGYGDVRRIEFRKGLRLELGDGSKVRLGLQSRHAYDIVAALKLRVAYSLERRGRLGEALELYKDASDHHEPPLDARMAFVLWRSGHGEPDEDETDDRADDRADDQDDEEAAEPGDAAAERVHHAIRVDRQGDILTHLHLAAWEHGDRYGEDHPTTTFLRRAIERFRGEYPEAEVDDSAGGPASQRRERLALRGDGEKPLEDRWLPVEGS